ncbi:MAG: hypothetical protein Tsb0016_13340 [Sphingomonadales bacterium]
MKRLWARLNSRSPGARLFVLAPMALFALVAVTALAVYALPNAAGAIFAAAGVCAFVGGLAINWLGSRWYLSIRRSIKSLEEAVAARVLGEPEDLATLAMPPELNGLRAMMVKTFDRLRVNADKAARLAYVDSLTALPNRARFKRLAVPCISAARTGGAAGALMFIDLDRFKQVNDTLGHAQGDRILELFAKRLLTALRLREPDGQEQPGAALTRPLLARFGGDEFTILIPDIAEEAHVARVAGRIISAFEEPFEIAGQTVQIGVSIGIACFPSHGEDFDSLLLAADTAMYHAKEQGRNNFQFYSADLNRKAMERFVLEGQLREALRTNQFQLHYQPQVCVQSGAITGVEALVRWRHPNGDLVTPFSFVPAAEESGIIAELGEWVIDEACRQAAMWAAEDQPMLMAINVSPRQFETGALVEQIASALKRHRLPGELLEIEITETTAMAGLDSVLEQVAQLKRHGVRLAIDDFGTGYSNLALLQKMPVDRIKIDRSLVSPLEDDDNARAVIKLIISMARLFGCEVLAEGVETEAQLRILQEESCSLIQGYFISRPVPADVITQRFLQAVA